MFNSLAALLLIGLFGVPIGAEKVSEIIQAKPLDACRHMKSRQGLDGYERGGPYRLEHFRLTQGRTDLRGFLWKNWHNNTKGIADVRAGTVDRGIVKVLYLIHPDEHGRWGIDVEMDRPMDPPCVTWHADSLIRVPIQKPNEDYPSQTPGIWPPGKLPQKRLADSDIADAKLYRVVFVVDNKTLGDAI